MVRVDAAKHSVDRRNTELALKSMPRERRVVRFDVHLEVLVQAILPQEPDRRCSVEIVLMLHRFFRLRLDVEIAFKTNASAIIDRHMHKAGDVLFFEFDVGVQKGFIPFATAPKDVTAAAKLDREIQSLLDLGSREAIDVALFVEPAPFM